MCITGYLVEGFLALQHAVDSELIDFVAANVTLKVPEVTMRLQRFPYPPYVHDSFVLVIQNQLPFIVLLSFIFFAMQIVRDLVYEKERRLKVLSFIPNPKGGESLPLSSPGISRRVLGPMIFGGPKHLVRFFQAEYDRLLAW